MNVVGIVFMIVWATTLGALAVGSVVLVLRAYWVSRAHETMLEELGIRGRETRVRTVILPES